MSAALQRGQEWLRATRSPLVKKRSRTRKGNPHLRKVLVQAAHAAKQKRGSFYRAKYNKWKFKLGSANKAKVAVANRIARAIYKVLAEGQYREIGYQRAMEHEEKIKRLRICAKINVRFVTSVEQYISSPHGTCFF